MNNNNSCGYPKQQRSRQRAAYNTNCPCNYDSETMSSFPDYPVVAMAYVPFQQRGEVYSCEKALMRGTLFPCLDRPFMMGCCK